MREQIWSFPNECEDIVVYKENIDNHTFYSVDIESYIYYDTLQEGINYLTTLKDKLLEWIKTEFNFYELAKEQKPYKKSDIIYRSYDIEILNIDGQITIWLNAPKFYHILDTYEWLYGVVEQLKKIRL